MTGLAVKLLSSQFQSNNANNNKGDREKPAKSRGFREQNDTEGGTNHSTNAGVNGIASTGRQGFESLRQVIKTPDHSQDSHYTGPQSGEGVGVLQPDCPNNLQNARYHKVGPRHEVRFLSGARVFS